MKEVLLVKFGEIVLKGLNRPVFERTLVKNIKNALADFEGLKITRAQSAIYIEKTDDSDLDDVLQRLTKVIGVLSVTRACVVEKDMNTICKAAVEYVGADLQEGVTY